MHMYVHVSVKKLQCGCSLKASACLLAKAVRAGMPLLTNLTVSNIAVKKTAGEQRAAAMRH